MNLKKPFNSYKGDGKFAYACYSLEDSDFVFPFLLKLSNDRYRIRYDEGVQDNIEVDALRKHNIKKCEIFLVFISQKALLSPYFLNQIEMAKQFDCDIYLIYLEGGDTVEQASKFFDPRTRNIKVDECTDELLYDIVTQLLVDCREPELIEEKHLTYDELLDEAYPDQENQNKISVDSEEQFDSEKLDKSAAYATQAAEKAKNQKRKKTNTSFFNAILVVGVMIVIVVIAFYFFGDQINEFLGLSDDVGYISAFKQVDSPLGVVSRFIAM